MTSRLFQLSLFIVELFELIQHKRAHLVLTLLHHFLLLLLKYYGLLDKLAESLDLSLVHAFERILISKEFLHWRVIIIIK